MSAVDGNRARCPSLFVADTARSRCYVRQDFAVFNLRKNIRHKNTMTEMKISNFILIKSNS